MIIADGRNHVELTDRTYDIIVVDPPPPIESSGVSVISSLEFYQAAHARLNPGGVMMQWVAVRPDARRVQGPRPDVPRGLPDVIVAQGPGGYGFLHVRVGPADRRSTTRTIREVLARPGDPRRHVVGVRLARARRRRLGGPDPRPRPALRTTRSRRSPAPGPLITDDHPAARVLPPPALARARRRRGCRRARSTRPLSTEAAPLANRLRPASFRRPGDILGLVTLRTLDAASLALSPGGSSVYPRSLDRPHRPEPAVRPRRAPARRVRAVVRSPRSPPAHLGRASPPATRARPRSARWAFQRAWWDAYGATAHEQTLVVRGRRRRRTPAASRSCRSCIATRSSRPTPTDRIDDPPRRRRRR